MSTYIHVHTNDTYSIQSNRQYWQRFKNVLSALGLWTESLILMRFRCVIYYCVCVDGGGLAAVGKQQWKQQQQVSPDRPRNRKGSSSKDPLFPYRARGSARAKLFQECAIKPSSSESQKEDVNNKDPPKKRLFTTSYQQSDWAQRGKLCLYITGGEMNEWMNGWKNSSSSDT